MLIIHSCISNNQFKNTIYTNATCNMLLCGVVLRDLTASSTPEHTGCGGRLRSKHASECQACESEARVRFLWDGAGM